MYKAIQAGYRLLDGAGDYGNEKEAGDGVKRAIADGLVKREELCELFSVILNKLSINAFYKLSRPRFARDQMLKPFKFC